MYLFQHQFVVIAAEKKGITNIILFVTLIYGEFWNEALLAEQALLNDTKLLGRIQKYPNCIIGDAW